MSIKYNKKPVNLTLEYLSKDKLDKINSTRAKQGKFKVGYQNFLGRIDNPGYLIRSIKNKNHELLFTDDKSKSYLVDEIEVNSYCYRESAIIRHQDMFTDQQKIIGYHNGELLTKDNFNQKTQSMYDRLVKESENDNSNVQLAVLSFDPTLTKEMQGKLSQEQLYEKTETLFKDFTEQNGYNFDNLDYFFSLHSDKKHLHMHIVYLEKVKDRKRGKLDIQHKYDLENRMTSYVESKLGERDYERVALDKNLIDNLKKDVSMDPKLFQKLSGCSAKKVGYIKDKELQQQLYDYTDKLLDASGCKEQIENNYHKREQRLEQGFRFTIPEGMSNEEWNLKTTNDEYDRIKKDTANYIYSQIPKNDKKVQFDYELNKDDVRKKNFNLMNKDYDPYEYKQFNTQMDMQRIKYLMFATKNDQYIWRSFVNNFKKGAKDADKNQRTAK